ncbi:MAG: hypothetical protein GY938_17040 [Ketobacter sp.]|nr:hypothetical protein [Ketobacter sp.]
MNKYLHISILLFLVSCGGGGDNNAPPVEEFDPYIGVWVSSCTSSIFANGSQLPIDVSSFIETISISKLRVTSTFEIYEGPSCDILNETLTSLAPEYGGVLVDVEELESDNGYAYRRYNTQDDIVGENAIEVALIDGILYRVFLDHAVFESSNEIQNNVIFEWHFSLQQ